MPDWFYRTVSRPILFRLPPVRARSLALGVIGRLARLPLGPAVIDFLGHMRADPRLRQSVMGIDFPSAIGLGPWLDARASALPALARFGVGFIEVGPITVAGGGGAKPIARRVEQEAIWLPDPPESLSVARVRPRLLEATRLGQPIFARLGATPDRSPEQITDDCRSVVRELAPLVEVFTLDTLRRAVRDAWSPEEWTHQVRSVVAVAQQAPPVRPVLVCVPTDAIADKVDPLLDAAHAAGASGFLVDGSIAAAPAGRLIGLPARAVALTLVKHLRLRFGPEVAIVGAGGVHEPMDALALRAHGADLVQVDSGLVYTGPGLPKRINEVLLFERARINPRTEPSERAADMTWLWTTLMGTGMLLGSLLALVIAATRVVLPYDEAFVGMSRAELDAVNPRLLAFMAHDRVSLAGTMVAIGILYLGLSLWGVRRGLHWARQAIYYSAFTGFASFFLFLGFGYLDTFHAFVTAALLQFLLLAVHCRLGTYTPTVRPALRGDAAWRRMLWGQLALIVHGVGLLGAGAVISCIGVSGVFVPEDLAFMQTTAAALQSANPRLVPLVAHDRATFGGMLLAAGWVFLLPALWDMREGSAWLWWTMLGAGLTAYAAAIGVHFAVGYVDFHHLLPACSGLAVFLAGMVLSREFVCRHS